MDNPLANQVNLYGAGGHSRVVAATLLSQGTEVGNQFDDNVERVNKSQGRLQLGARIAPESFSQFKSPFILAIGNNEIRSQLASELRVEFTTAIHAKAIVTDDVRIGIGSVVFAGAIIQSGCHLGEHVIINTAASVDHDCRVGDFVHVSPGATICGGVEIGAGAHIGAGATIIPGVKIGRWSTVGAGAVVIRDVPDRATVVGCPANRIK